jgi:hypothetical protein
MPVELLKILGPAAGAVVVVMLFLKYWTAAQDKWGESRDEERKLAAEERQRMAEEFRNSLTKIEESHAIDRQLWREYLTQSQNANAALVEQNTRMVEHCIKQCNQKGI